MISQKEPIIALLVYSDESPLAGLRVALAGQSVETYRARTCQHTRSFLGKANQHPHIVFTDTALADGAWTDVLAAAGEAQSAVDVIVVSRWLGMKVYVDALERGAFDFMTPPFEVPELNHVLRRAAHDVLARRVSTSMAASA
ncbi:MAG TPA: hypothetical protein VGW33_04010 [Terriglobia bacterium]|nr:hypothetical protein [Terriglobia bacterium]